MGKTFKDRKENREYNKKRRTHEGPKMTPYNRTQERREKCTS